MDFLKVLFENGAIDWDTFCKAVTEKGFKIADLSQGAYVSKNKYDDDINAKTTQINDLTGQINQRNADLQDLQSKMEAAQGDTSKLTEVTNQLNQFQENYNKMENKYKTQIAKQQYEFAVKEFANEQKFTSAAAKRDFIRSLTDKGLQIENGKIVGAIDYLNTYKQENTDAIAVEDNKPQFVNTTNKKTDEPKPNPFLEAMNFTGVRPELKK